MPDSSLEDTVDRDPKMCAQLGDCVPTRHCIDGLFIPRRYRAESEPGKQGHIAQHRIAGRIIDVMKVRYPTWTPNDVRQQTPILDAALQSDCS